MKGDLYKEGRLFFFGFESLKEKDTKEEKKTNDETPAHSSFTLKEFPNLAEPSRTFPSLILDQRDPGTQKRLSFPIHFSKALNKK